MQLAVTFPPRGYERSNDNNSDASPHVIELTWHGGMQCQPVVLQPTHISSVFHNRKTSTDNLDLLEGCAGLREYRFIVDFIYVLPNHEVSGCIPFKRCAILNFKFSLFALFGTSINSSKYGSNKSVIHILCLTDREITANKDCAGATLQ